MNPSNPLLQHTLVINLESRLDRLIHAIQQLKSVGVENPQRFNAVETKSKNGRIGCTMSHIRCLELAKTNNWKQVFICEDDITFTNPALFNTSLNKFTGYYNVLERDGAETEEEKTHGLWDVLLVAGNILPPFADESELKGCFRIQDAQTCTGYIVRQHYYDVLIENFKQGLKLLIQQPNQHYKFACDMYWKELQKKDSWFIVAPLTVIQYSNWSDIEKKDVNYENWMLDPHKDWLFSNNTLAQQKMQFPGYKK